MRIRLTAPARRDVTEVLDWSVGRFGSGARRRYEQLIGRALHDLTQATDPLGSKPLPEAGPSVHLCDLRHARKSATRAVRQPRHVLVYRQAEPHLIVILRVLHDAMDFLARLLDDGWASVGCR